MNERTYDPSRWMTFLHGAMVQARLSDYAEMCRKANIRQSTINRWRQGSQPGTDAIRKLSKALNVAVRDLLIAAGHFNADELAGGDDVLSTILGSELLDDKTKLRLIEEWRKRERERDEQFRALIHQLLSTKISVVNTEESGAHS